MNYDRILIDIVSEYLTNNKDVKREEIRDYIDIYTKEELEIFLFCINEIGAGEYIKDLFICKNENGYYIVDNDSDDIDDINDDEIVGEYWYSLRKHRGFVEEGFLEEGGKYIIQFETV